MENMKKIKLKTLIDKIYQNEEIPKQIYYYNEIFIYDLDEGAYLLQGRGEFNKGRYLEDFISIMNYEMLHKIVEYNKNVDFIKRKEV